MIHSAYRDPRLSPIDKVDSVEFLRLCGIFIGHLHGDKIVSEHSEQSLQCSAKPKYNSQKHSIGFPFY